jgi:hypothetical protein
MEEDKVFGTAEPAQTQHEEPSKSQNSPRPASQSNQPDGEQQNQSAEKVETVSESLTEKLDNSNTDQQTSEKPSSAMETARSPEASGQEAETDDRQVTYTSYSCGSDQ